MKNFIALLLSCFLAVSTTFAQGRKLPEISFLEHSTEYANANRSYNNRDEFTDTLKDEAILVQLAAILNKNIDLVIEISGHTAINEKSELGFERAMKVKQFLVENGIDSNRLQVVNVAHEKPIINDEILFSLPTKEEKEAANQKNRRVEIKVVGKREE